VDQKRSSGGVHIKSSDGKEPGDAGRVALRALDDCCLNEVDSGKALLVGVEEKGISRSVVKGGKDAILNFPTSWNSRCSQKTTRREMRRR
jgi:hypothetical protein